MEPSKNGPFGLILCPDKMSDGTPGIVQRMRQLPTLTAAKRELRSSAKHPNWPTGYYWLEDRRGVPIYGLVVTEEPKTERVPTTRHNPTFPGSQYQGFTTRKVPGQVQRVLKAGNMPWNR